MEYGDKMMFEVTGWCKSGGNILAEYLKCEF
jgi:hypothetical protein